MDILLWLAPIAVLVLAIVMWGRSLPYPFSYEGKTYYRLRNGTFVDETKKNKIVDPSLIAALVPAHKNKKDQDARNTDPGESD